MNERSLARGTDVMSSPLMLRSLTSIQMHGHPGRLISERETLFTFVFIRMLYLRVLILSRSALTELI
jgi:hypothetical protein